MKPLLFIFALCLPGLAFAGGSDCPKGNNVKLTDSTTPTTTTTAPASSTGNGGSHKGVKNHYPH